MKERFLDINMFQKALILFIAVMILAFTVVYGVTTHRAGYAWKDVIFTPTEENDATIYTGKVEHRTAKFTVTADKTVTLQYGSKTYGPYTIREDGSAVPKTDKTGQHGVEIRCDDELYFRGFYYETTEGKCLLNEDGTWYVRVTLGISDGTVTDDKGNRIDPMEPSPKTLIELADGPVMVHRGNWMMWLFAVLCGLSCVVSILFAEDLFMFKMFFRVKNHDLVEPSSFEIVGRYVLWASLTVGAFVIFLIGLKQII